MKPRTLFLLLLSHVGLALLGGWMAGRSRDDSPVVAISPPPVVAKAPVSPPAGEETTNPILLATGADFRAAWDELLAGPRSSDGEPGGNSISFFMDWCRVDPDGAVQGLGRIYAPRFAHNYLNNAVDSFGAELAPALVRHHRLLRRLPGYKVQSYVGRSLCELAKQDPDAAAALTGDLPPGIRARAYGDLFYKHDTVTIQRLLKGLQPLASGASDEKAALWGAVARAVEAADPGRGLWEAMVSSTDVESRHAFVTEGMAKAYQSEDWTGFFGAVERMDPAARKDAREHLRLIVLTSGYRPEVRAAISSECQRRGLEDWLEGQASE
jgi:hypothetical protein